MKPAHPDPAEILLRVRQQLILAQVRIMELEDARDETGSRLADTGKLLEAAQSLTDQKLDEAAHSEKTRADLQHQFEHLRHVQHVTNEALENTRHQLTTIEQALSQERQTSSALATQLRQLQETQEKLESQLREVTATNTARQQRIDQLDAEVRVLKSSRSWRWTAWLRALERVFGSKKP